MSDFYPNSPRSLLLWKQLSVRLYRSDIFEETDSPGWKDRHRLGPVHIDITCRLCKKIIKSDLPEYGWLEDDSYYKQHLEPHYVEHVNACFPPLKPPVEADYSI